MKTDPTDWSRRNFLKTGAFAAAVTAGLGRARTLRDKKDGKPDPARIRNYHPDMVYRPLGTTGEALSVITLGGIGLEKSVLQYAVDRGVNVIHMSNGYDGGRSIRLLGELMKTKRDKVYIALKDSFSDIDENLALLNTDHVDFLMFNRHDADAVADPEIARRFAEWKKQGKVRFAGLTSHNNVLDCAAAGIRSGVFSVIQPVLNQSAFEGLQPRLEEARAKGIGVMGMKTMQGMKDLDMEAAYLKKLLSHPAVVTVSRTIRSFEVFEAYLKAAKETLSAGDSLRLYRNARIGVCMMCGSCEKECPRGIAISTLLRSKMYYQDQLGHAESAREAWLAARPAGVRLEDCRSCRKCESACPNGIAVADRLAETGRFFETALV
jgi:uncharacterized protein